MSLSHLDIELTLWTRKHQMIYLMSHLSFYVHIQKRSRFDIKKRQILEKNLRRHLGVGQIFPAIFNYPRSLEKNILSLALEFLYFIFPGHDCKTGRLHIVCKVHLVPGQLFVVQRWKIHSTAKAYQLVTALEYNYSTSNSAIKKDVERGRTNTCAWNLNPSKFFSLDCINRFPFLNHHHASTSSQICWAFVPMQRASLMLPC